MPVQLSQAATSTDLLSASSLAPVLDQGSLTTPALGLGRASQSLLFIDGGVQDYSHLVAGVAPGTEVHVLDPVQDAVTQITQALLGREGITSLHIVSHGESGGLDFGSSRLNLSDLPGYAAQLQSWGQALTADADILLYGCDVASGELGKAFVQILGQVTGADVAASDDLTGSSALGGDWTLEYQTGEIEAFQPFDSWAQAAYSCTLATIAVTNTDDSGAGSLREAILESNGNGEDNTIIFDGSIFTDASPDTIVLTSDELGISSNISLLGTGADRLTISGSGYYSSRVFNISSGSTVGIDGVTIANGGSDYGGGIYNAGTMSLSNSTLSGNSAYFGGGGIYNGGTVSLSNSTLSSNSASNGGGIYNALGTVNLSNSTLSSNLASNGGGGGSGGGIYNALGTMSLSNSTLSSNDSASEGGGIYNGGTVNLSNSTLSSNSAYGSSGGGIYNAGTVSLSNSTLSSNLASFGGGIYNALGTVNLSNSTLSSNLAYFYGGGGGGGGIYNVGTMSLSNSTLSGNLAEYYGGGIHNDGTMSLSNSTLSGNSASEGDGISNNIYSGTFTALQNNLFADSSLVGVSPDATNLVGTAASLGLDSVLRNNGGFTQTHALLPGSARHQCWNQHRRTHRRPAGHCAGRSRRHWSLRVPWLHHHHNLWHPPKRRPQHRL